jgi:hypothetical protein
VGLPGSNCSMRVHCSSVISKRRAMRASSLGGRSPVLPSLLLHGKMIVNTT